MNEWTDRWMMGQTKRREDRRADDRGKDRRADGQTDGWTDGQTAKVMGTWCDGQTD